MNTTTDFLLACASGRRDAEARADLAVCLTQEVDWTDLLERARQHGLLSLIYDRLRELDGVHGPAPHPSARVPPAVMARLKAAFYTNVVRTGRLAEQLEAVVAALQRDGVTPIVLKGGALGRTVYPNPALRPMADLDLLVRPEQMPAARAPLTALGFRLPASARMLPFQQSFGGGLDWQRESHDGSTLLDLQHHIIGVDFVRSAFPVDVEALWERARPLSVGHTQTLQLSPEDTLIHLCLHPALHDGFAGPLIGTVDMDRVIRTAGSDAPSASAFWTRVVERTVRFRVRTAVAYGLLAARRLLATPVPDDVLSALRPSRPRLDLLQRLAPLDVPSIMDRTGRAPTGARQLLLYAVLMDRPRDAAGMVRRILFPDSAWLTVRYGLESAAQVRRYRLTHPLRVIRASVRALRRPLTQSGLE